MPSGLSPSSLNAYLECGRRWAYDKIAYIPGVSSAAMLVGTHVHRVLELVVAGPPPDRTLDRALTVHRRLLRDVFALADRFCPQWTPVAADKVARKAIAAATDDDYLAGFVAEMITLAPNVNDLAVPAERALRSYFAMSKDPAALRIVDTELRLSGEWETPSGVVPVRGVIDRVDRLPDDTLAAWDYKTGRKQPDRFDDGAYRRQLLFYAAMLRDHYGEIPTVGGILYLGHDDTEPHGQPVIHRFTDADVDEFVNWAGTVWADMRARFRAGVDYQADVGPLCGWCPHVAYCPEGRTEVARRADVGTGRGGMRADAPARELLELPAA